MRKPISAGATVAALLVVAIVGCGDGSANQAAPPAKTVTVERTAPSAAPAPEESAPVEPEAGTDITVPDVVGRDHQAAQDRMQEAGLFNLAEEDATGQGRALLVDRNWTVVEQSPKAGSKVKEDRTITLRSKKKGE